MELEFFDCPVPMARSFNLARAERPAKRRITTWLTPLSVMGPPVNEDPLVDFCVSSVWSSLFGAWLTRSRSQGAAPAAQRERTILTRVTAAACWRGSASGTKGLGHGCLL